MTTNLTFYKNIFFFIILFFNYSKVVNKTSNFSFSKYFPPNKKSIYLSYKLYVFSKKDLRILSTWIINAFVSQTIITVGWPVLSLFGYLLKYIKVGTK